LREHARSRASWQIGDAASVEAIVEFNGPSAPAAATLGEPADANDGIVRRRFVVRRVDAFVRWLLSFAGGARPIGPEEVVNEYRRHVVATLALYRLDVGLSLPPSPFPLPGRSEPPDSRARPRPLPSSFDAFCTSFRVSPMARSTPLPTLPPSLA
jgi:hypothetical protein